MLEIGVVGSMGLMMGVDMGMLCEGPYLESMFYILCIMHFSVPRIEEI